MNACIGTIRQKAVIAWASWLLLQGLPSGAQESTPPPAASSPRMTRSLVDEDLETLFNTRVTTVTRTPRKLSSSAAAIHVVTDEEIERTGATTLPEALRYVPGVHVGRVDAHTWAISARGFNDVFANKLLVLIDGRSIYTPLFSGVLWDEKDVLMEDIERIEVIRGPGASLWGANAVNGIINIISKSARDTQGGLVSAGLGTEERVYGGFRYGDKLAENAFFRVYGKYLDHDDSASRNGDPSGDSWQRGQGGFRIDWEASPENLLTLQGDLYGGHLDQSFTVPTTAPPFARLIRNDRVDIAGGNLLGRWTRTFSEFSDLSFQAYYDRTRRHSPILEEDRNLFDLDFQHRLPIGDIQEFIWGLGYRVTWDQIESSPAATPNLLFSPSRQTDHLFSAFLQDDLSLFDDRLHFILGSKFEINDYTGFEIQPSGRVAWIPTDRHTVWGAVSRAVRTPSRAEEDILINQPGIPPGFAPLRGSAAFDSEIVMAYELGYRVRVVTNLTADLALFYNDYSRLRSLEPPAAFPGPVIARNRLEGETYGVETSLLWQAAPWWRWNLGYTYLQMQLHRTGAGRDASTERSDEGRNPHHQMYLKSSMDLPANLMLDLMGRYVDSLPSINVPSYVAVDARVSWAPRKDLELSIVGRNLLDSQHPEFAPSFVRSTMAEIERSVFAKVKWKF